MAQRGKLSRRSFLTRVAGAAVVTGAAGTVAGCATTGYTDSDVGRYGDPAGAGRGGSGGYGSTGATDSDTGRYADPVGNGRGGGYTDTDTGRYADPVGGGRGGGVTDSDTGSYSDPAGRGRGSSVSAHSSNTLPCSSAASATAGMPTVRLAPTLR